MNEPPTLDPAALQRLRRIGGPKLLGEMIDLMLVEGPRRVRAALAGAQAGSAKEVALAVHSLKSSAGNLGALALQDLAEQIEVLATTDQLSACEGLLNRLQQEMQSVQTRLQEERGKLS
jgi:HPt (histidine-containing phosphotransfer) domain-containing protein